MIVEHSMGLEDDTAGSNNYDGIRLMGATTDEHDLCTSLEDEDSDSTRHRVRGCSHERA